MAEDNGGYSVQLPADDLDALCTRIATCAVTMSPLDQLAVIKSFGMNPDSSEDMQILYAGVQIALSRIPRERAASRSPSPDREFASGYLNLPEDDDDVQNLPERLQMHTISSQHSRKLVSTPVMPDVTSSHVALRDVQVSLERMQISRRLASKRNGMDDLVEDKRSSRAAPYVHNATETHQNTAKRYTLNQNHYGTHNGKEFVGQKQRNADDPLVCLWDRSTCKAVISSGRNEDILAHLSHYHGFVISGAPVLKQMCQWGEKCRIYVHDANMVDHIARKGRGEGHCRYDEHRCKICLKVFSNVDKLVGHVIRSHKGVVLH